MPKPKVYIGGALWRHVEAGHVLSLASLLQDPHYQYGPPHMGDALVERARGISATNFLQTDGDIHLSLDSDIVDFRKDAIDMMCEQAMEYGIVGAVYICRAVGRTKPASLFEDDQPITFGERPKPGSEWVLRQTGRNFQGEMVTVEMEATPVPIRWIATGCVAVHRRVFEAMAKDMQLLHERDADKGMAFYNFYGVIEHEDEVEIVGADGQPTKVIDHILLSEDFAFSERARQYGFTSYVNPAVRVGHMGSYTYRLEDLAENPPLLPQPITVEKHGPYWRTKCAGLRNTPEDIGRVARGKGEDIEKLFENRAERRRTEKEQKKALARV